MKISIAVLVSVAHCYFCNPNIQPQEEYEKRLAEARRIARHFEVAFDSDAYDPGLWEKAVEPWDHTSEGGERCMQCFLVRMQRCAAFCRERGLERFATVMSVSPYKSAAQLDRAGNQAAAEYGVCYEPFNFKKNNGFNKSVHLSRELGLYRQDYCGCRLSRRERDVRRSAR